MSGENNPGNGMSEWKECKLGDVVSIDTGYPFKSKFYREEGSLKVVRGKNVTIGRLRWGSDAKYWQESIDKLGHYFLSENDIVIGMDGSRIGKNRALVKKIDMPSILAQRVARLRANDRADQLFLWHLIFSNAFKNYIKAIHTGTSIPHISQSQIADFEILLPPLPEQKAIASVLSSLDDKIDLLHRQNKTLEAMAETLFRQWFVEEAEEGWEAVKLEGYINCITGYSYKSADLNSSNKALVTLKNFARDGSFRMDGFKEYTGNFKETQVVKQGDLVVSHTDITQEADIIGNPVLVIDTGKYETLIITMDLMKVESTEEWLSREFLYYLFKSPDFKFHCLGCSNGTTVLHMNRKAIPSYEFKIPNKEKVIEFTDNIKPVVEKKFKNISQIRNLEKLRDTLLPKLMSGEVRVVVEEAGVEEETVDPISPYIEGGITPWPVNNKFREAALFSGVVAEMGDEMFNPDRVRVTKAGYLAKRYMGMEVLGEYAKMEAGPYDSSIRYRGPEKIAIKNNYVEAVETTHFKRGEKFQDVEKYLERYGYMPALEWLAQFKYMKNKELELLATVDYAALDLMRQEKDVTVEGIMAYLEKDKKWSKKLEKKADVFNEEGVRGALKKLSVLFTKTYNRVPK